MALDILHVGDVGIAIEVVVIDRETKQPRDLSGFISGKIRITKPDGDVVDKTASLVGDGTEGTIRYVTQSGDLDQAGSWRAQAYQVLTSTDGPWSGDVDSFVVRPNL